MAVVYCAQCDSVHILATAFTKAQNSRGSVLYWSRFIFIMVWTKAPCLCFWIIKLQWMFGLFLISETWMKVIQT